MNLTLYITNKGGKYLVYTPENMAKIEVTQDGEVYKLDTPELVAKWFAFKNLIINKVDIVLKEWLDRDNTAVEDALFEFDETARQYRRNSARWEGVVVEKAVLAWDMWHIKESWKQTASESVLSEMPYELASILKAVISGAVYGGVSDTDFFV